MRKNVTQSHIAAFKHSATPKRWASTTSTSASSSSVLHRERIARLNPDVNAFVSVSPLPPPTSRENGKGKGKGKLQGTTVAIKDNISTSFLRTTCSSGILKDYIAPYDATVVKLLQAEGADIIGKTNCDEFGMGSLNVHSVHGPVRNPTYPSNDPPRSAGGSSGGSAAAVAAGMCDVALGTDTGGSVRLPASYCSIVGFKPSYGRLSRWGVVSYADSLDCVGILAKEVGMVEKVFDVLDRYDERDPTSAPEDIRKLASDALKRAVATNGSTTKPKLRIGIPAEYFPSELSPSIITSFRSLLGSLQHELGVVFVPITLPSTKYALSGYYVLASAEAGSNLGRYDGVQFGSHENPPPGTDLSKTNKVYSYTRTKGFGDEVKKRVLLGAYALSADAFENYFLQAIKVRQMVKDDFDRVFRVPNYSDDPSSSSGQQSKVDLILHPSAIKAAPLLEATAETIARDGDGVQDYVQDVLTVPASLAGLPALSVPMGVGVGRVGVSIVGQWGMDGMVLGFGKEVERVFEMYR